MADPVISEIKYLGSGDLDFLEVRVPDDYPDPENLRMVIYDRTHNGSSTASPAANDIYDVTSDGLLYTEDVDSDGNDDDGVLHYTFGTSENGTNIRLHAQDAVGLYNVATGETYGFYNWSTTPYVASTATGDPFAGQTATMLDNTGQVNGVTSLERTLDGDYVLATTPTPGESYICFTDGTWIETLYGPKPVEDLQIGDMVVTKDHGPQAIRWIGRRKLQGLDTAHVKAQPIVIKAHAFGPGLPAQDIALSPNHAVLNDHWRATLYFGEQEVMMPAKAFLTSDKAFQQRCSEVTYTHLLLDQHSLIMANGLWVESLFLGSECMEMLSPAHRLQVFDSFTHLAGDIGGYGRKVRAHLNPKEAALLI